MPFDLQLNRTRSLQIHWRLTFRKTNLNASSSGAVVLTVEGDCREFAGRDYIHSTKQLRRRLQFQCALDGQGNLLRIQIIGAFYAIDDRSGLQGDSSMTGFDRRICIHAPRRYRKLQLNGVAFLPGPAEGCIGFLCYVCTIKYLGYGVTGYTGRFCNLAHC